MIGTAPRERHQSIGGGFVLVGVAALMAAWRACQGTGMGSGCFRAWLACHEMTARRQGKGSADGRLPLFTAAELADLTGTSERHARESIRRLVAAGLVRFDETAITFPEPPTANDPQMGDTIGRGRGTVAVPRRLLRWLADGAPAATIAAALGMLLRCLSRRKAGWDGRGRVKASWIARTFGVDLRRVKAARAGLVALGWIAAEPGDAWAERRWGRAYRIDLDWTAPAVEGRPTATITVTVPDVEPTPLLDPVMAMIDTTGPTNSTLAMMATDQPTRPTMSMMATVGPPPPTSCVLQVVPPAGATLPPISPPIRPTIATPNVDRDPLAERKKTQNPPPGGPAGARLGRTGEVKPRGLNSSTDRPGPCPSVVEEVASTLPRPGPETCSPLPPPRLDDIRREDLADTARLLDLHRQAVDRGLVPAGEAGRLRFVAAAEHARGVGTVNAPGLLARIVRGGLWRYLTAEDEDRARRRLREFDRGPVASAAPPAPPRRPADPDGPIAPPVALGGVLAGLAARLGLGR